MNSIRPSSLFLFDCYESATHLKQTPVFFLMLSKQGSFPPGVLLALRVCKGSDIGFVMTVRLLSKARDPFSLCMV